MGMSFPGYRVRKSLSQTISLIDEFRQGHEDRAYRRKAEIMSLAICEMLDRYAFGLSGLTASNFASVVYEEIAQRHLRIDREKYADPEVDLSMEVVLFPRGRSTYIFIYTTQESWKREFIEHIGAEHYFWHDNERPENITARDWSRRKALWKGIFKDSHVPNRVGLVAHLSSVEGSFKNPTLGDLHAAQPSLETRAKILSKALVAKAYPNPSNISGVFSWLVSDEAKAMEDRKIIELMLKMRPIPIEHLTVTPGLSEG